MDRWIFGIFTALVGLLGLYLSQAAIDLGMAEFGVGLFAFGAFFNFFLLTKRS